MAPATELRTHGLEELRWQSLTRPEKLLIAGFLESARQAPAHLHLETVAFELREAARPGLAVPLVLTSQQNRVIAQVLEAQSAALEEASEKFAAQPAVARSAHYAAGYLRSLVDRLVRGATAEREAGLERIVQLLLLDAPHEAGLDLAGQLVRAAAARLKELGLGEIFLPVLTSYAAEAVVAAATHSGPALAVDDAAYEFEIVDVTEERVTLADRIFHAALDRLAQDERGWPSFVADLGAGLVAGCETAREYSDVAESAASTAFALASAIRRHLTEMADSPWEAVSPGLKSILDSYPALKRQAAVKEFVKAEVRKRFEVKPGAGGQQAS
jgi:hypothetical protein